MNWNEIEIELNWNVADTLYLDSTVNASTPIDSPSKLRDLHFRLALESTLADPSDITVNATHKEYSLPIIDPQPEVDDSIQQLSAIYLPAVVEPQPEVSADLEEAIQPEVAADLEEAIQPEAAADLEEAIQAEFTSFTVDTEEASDSACLEEVGHPEVTCDSASAEPTGQQEVTGGDSVHLEEAIRPPVTSHSTDPLSDPQVKDFEPVEVSGSIRTSHLIPFSPSSCSEVSSVAESETGSAVPFTPSRARNDVDVDLLDQFERLSVTKSTCDPSKLEAVLTETQGPSEETESGASATPLENPIDTTIELPDPHPAASVATPQEAWFNEREESVVVVAAAAAAVNETEPEVIQPEAESQSANKSARFDEETLPEPGAPPVASGEEAEAATTTGDDSTCPPRDSLWTPFIMFIYFNIY